MATMYPPRLREEEVKSRAEIRVFEALRDRLDGEWEVFHSASWIDRDPNTGAKDGEIDFVLCHPDHAILCLEVKGGGLECNRGAWWRIAPDGSREPMKDPFTQALDGRYALERQLRKKGLADGTMLVHALAFPDISVHRLVLAPDAPHQLVIDREEVKNISRAVTQVLAYHRGAGDSRAAPGKRGARLLRDHLAPTVTIPVPLATKILDDEERLIELTTEQSRLLLRSWREPRMAVTGCAGSGKTVLAVEFAERRARDGQRVAFVCFNKNLRENLKARHAKGGVRFFTFHSLCAHAAHVAQVALPAYPPGQAPPEYFDQELPNALVEAVDAIGPMFDCIVIDEAQDLSPDWLAALECTLADAPDAALWLFLDDNQRVYEKVLEIPNGYRRFDLTVNCRNTQAIHRAVLQHYSGRVEAEVLGPEGRDVELVASDDPPRAVHQVLRRLCENEEIPPQDIVVLSAHGTAKSAVHAAPITPYAWGARQGEPGKTVFFSSIRAFKGLESPVVVLCELDGLDPATREQQLYVAISRAREHCVIVVDPSGPASGMGLS